MTRKISELPGIPPWLNIDAVLTDEDLNIIAATTRDAVDLLEAVHALAQRVRPIYERWNELVAFELVDILEGPTGYKLLMDTIMLGGNDLLEAWDPYSVPTEEHVKKVRAEWIDGAIEHGFHPRKAAEEVVQ